MNYRKSAQHFEIKRSQSQENTSHSQVATNLRYREVGKLPETVTTSQ